MIAKFSISRAKRLFNISMVFKGNSYGYRPYVSGGISQQIRPTYGRRKRSAQNELNSRTYGSYANSYNKAGICPLYGRKRRSPENLMDGANSR